MFIIENVIMSDSSGFTLVSTEGRTIKVELTGDCCSHSFFDSESVLEINSVFGETLTGIEQVSTGMGEEGLVKNYALVITTNKQSLSLMWRNESNGYYSGSTAISIDGERDYSYDEKLAALLTGKERRGSN